MPIEQDAPQFSALDSAINDHTAALAARLTAGLPADQALGLRLIALARTAAAAHMGAAVLGGKRPDLTPRWTEPNRFDPSRTQAAGLAALREVPA